MSVTTTKTSECRSLILILTSRGTKKKRPSRNQQTFIKLSKQIEELQRGIQRETKKMEGLLKIYVSEVAPQKQLLAKTQVKIAKAIGSSTKYIKYGKRQREDLRLAIIMLCDDAFIHIEPDEETQQFYAMWANIDYGAGVENDYDIKKRTIASAVGDQFGIDIDPEEFENTAEGFARFQERVRKEFASRKEQDAAEDDKFGRRGDKERFSPGQLKKRQKEDLIERSIRAVFISLAKILHPDTTTDAEEKTRKEELMKKVTSAYASRDLPTLLKIEVECIRSAGKNAKVLPENLLKSYIASLKKQVKELEREFGRVHLSSRYSCVAHLVHRHTHYEAVREIHLKAQNHADYIEDLEDTLEQFSGQYAKHEIMTFIKEYISTLIRAPLWY